MIHQVFVWVSWRRVGGGARLLQLRNLLLLPAVIDVHSAFDTSINRAFMTISRARGNVLLPGRRADTVVMEECRNGRRVQADK